MSQNSQMTPSELEELKYKVAKALGWKFHSGSFNGSQTVSYPPCSGLAQGAWGTTENIPDYAKDLNAMHEAERSMDNDRLWYMSARLAEIVPAETPIAHATAAERAQAFLESYDKFLGEDE